MSVLKCAGVECDRLISVSMSPVGNPEALSDYAKWSFLRADCPGCGQHLCDRCVAELVIAEGPLTCQACGSELQAPDLEKNARITRGVADDAWKRKDYEQVDQIYERVHVFGIDLSGAETKKWEFAQKKLGKNTKAESATPNPSATSPMADFSTYQNNEYNFELPYPKDWSIIAENQTNQAPWVMPVCLGRRSQSSSKPDPYVSVMVNIFDDDGSPLSAYMTKAQQDLSGNFPGFKLVFAREQQHLGWPSAWMCYTYDSDKGPVQELNVTTFIGRGHQLGVQFLCEGAQVDHEILFPIFETMINGLALKSGWMRHPQISLAGATQCLQCGHGFEGKPVHAMMSMDQGRLIPMCDCCRRRV